MSDPVSPTPPPRGRSIGEQDAAIRVNRAEAAAMGFLLLGVLLLLVGIVLAVFKGRGLAFLVLGGVSFLAGLLENLRAEVLRFRGKLEKD